MKPRIGVLTSGGDCPGLNAVLRGVVLAAEKLGWEVVGFRDGFEGLLPPGNRVILDRQSINGIMALGGTIIGTTNRGHFVAKVGAGDRTIVPKNIIAGAKKILDELQVKALIIVGGDGSMVTAQQLQETGINCIGVPKTIDNDLEATDYTIGFQTAVEVVVEAAETQSDWTSKWKAPRSPGACLKVEPTSWSPKAPSMANRPSGTPFASSMAPTSG